MKGTDYSSLSGVGMDGCLKIGNLADCLASEERAWQDGAG